MPKGGARNRSGPSPDPTSGRSDQRNLVLTALPSQGWDGEAPPYPLEPYTVYSERWEGSGKSRERIRELDEDATAHFAEREQAIWVDSWTTPQACAWAAARWRWTIVAEYCRLKTVVEFAPSANAALVAQLHRYRDQIGLTPAGLKENGWAVATDEVAAKAAERTTAPAPRPRRLRAADGA